MTRLQAANQHFPGCITVDSGGLQGNRMKWGRMKVENDRQHYIIHEDEGEFLQIKNHLFAIDCTESRCIKREDIREKGAHLTRRQNSKEWHKRRLQ